MSDRIAVLKTLQLTTAFAMMGKDKQFRMLELKNLECATMMHVT